MKTSINIQNIYLIFFCVVIALLNFQAKYEKKIFKKKWVGVRWVALDMIMMKIFKIINMTRTHRIKIIYIFFIFQIYIWKYIETIKKKYKRNKEK